MAVTCRAEFIPMAIGGTPRQPPDPQLGECRRTWRAFRLGAVDSVGTCVVRVISSVSGSALRSTGVVAGCRRLFSLTWWVALRIG